LFCVCLLCCLLSALATPANELNESAYGKILAGKEGLCLMFDGLAFDQSCAD